MSAPPARRTGIVNASSFPEVGRMTRREFIALFGSVVAAPLTARAQQSGAKVPRLCFLTFDPGTPKASRFDPFFQGLLDLGHLDGQTISIDFLSGCGWLATGTAEIRLSLVDSRTARASGVPAVAKNCEFLAISCTRLPSR